MGERGKHFTMSQDLTIVPPRPEKAYTIPESEWKRLQRRVDRIGSGSRLYDNLGWLLLGIGATAFFSGVSAEPVKTLCWLVAVFLVALGALCLHFAADKRKSAQSLKSEIVEDMEQMASKYGCDD